MAKNDPNPPLPSFPLPAIINWSACAHDIVSAVGRVYVNCNRFICGLCETMKRRISILARRDEQWRSRRRHIIDRCDRRRAVTAGYVPRVEGETVDDSSSARSERTRRCREYGLCENSRRPDGGNRALRIVRVARSRDKGDPSPSALSSFPGSVFFLFLHFSRPPLISFS